MSLGPGAEGVKHSEGPQVLRFQHRFRSGALCEVEIDLEAVRDNSLVPHFSWNGTKHRPRELITWISAGQAFREMKITPRKRLLDDWFREGDTGFVFSRRGTGKTWLAWAIARAIARGEGFGPWSPGEEAAQVCYLDGEMPAELMQDRDKAFGEVCENLTLINHEILFEQTSLVLNLADPKVQRAITQWCVEVECKVLVIDNLSTLASGVKENDADAWELLLPRLLDLRRKKIAVLLVHHAGRSGEMRGTSRREDSVFWILKLEEQIDYDGLGCSFLSCAF
jgi:RecA-family ATPase